MYDLMSSWKVPRVMGYRSNRTDCWNFYDASMSGSGRQSLTSVIHTAYIGIVYCVATSETAMRNWELCLWLCGHPRRFVVAENWPGSIIMTVHVLAREYVDSCPYLQAGES